MPVSGITGAGLKDPVDKATCPWHEGEAFIPFIDSLPAINRKVDGPFIMPIVDKYKDMGTVVMGKVESGFAKKGQSLLVMPNRVSGTFVDFPCMQFSHFSRSLFVDTSFC